MLRTAGLSTFRQGPRIAARSLTWVLVVASLVGTQLSIADEPIAAENGASASGASVDFDSEVLSLLTQAGCNTGACHGAAVGRGGFRLSLYGQDPALDWQRIARELNGRRINPADAESSLLLRKAGEFIEHGGGMRLDPSGTPWSRIAKWIDSGAIRGRDPERRLVGITATPHRIQIPTGAESREPIQVTATTASGEKINVSDWALITPQDPASLEITADLTIRALRPGRHVLMVRVRNLVVANEVLVPVPSDALAEAKTTPSKVRAPVSDRDAELIDNAIDRRLHSLGVAALPAADPSDQLRRVTLDLAGRLPTINEWQSYQQDPRPDRYRHRVDQLLSSDEANTFWTYWLARQMRVMTLLTSPQQSAAERLQKYLGDHVQNQTSLVEVSAQLIEAAGTIEEDPATAFYYLANDGRSQTEVFSEILLGSRMGCANCHDHPFDHWTQDDYHGLAALFVGVRRGDGIHWVPGATNTHPATGEPAQARLPNGLAVATDRDPRPRLSEWVRGQGRHLVARNWCNRIWSALMGRGLVSPVDDHRVTNPPSHPQLLDELTDQWLQHDARPEWLIRQIVTSRVYRRQSVFKKTPAADSLPPLATSLYAARTPRPLMLAVWADAVDEVTKGRQADHRPAESGRYVGRLDFAQRDFDQGTGGRRNQLNCVADRFCDDELEPTLTGRLSEISSAFLNARLVDPDGMLSEWAELAPRDPDSAIDQLYLLAFSRAPSSEEREFWRRELAMADTPRAVLEDMVWSLLTSQRFTSND